MLGQIFSDILAARWCYWRST